MATNTVIPAALQAFLSSAPQDLMPNIREQLLAYRTLTRNLPLPPQLEKTLSECRGDNGRSIMQMPNHDKLVNIHGVCV